MPNISVIIPAYNAGTTIVDSVNSVCQQTISDLEIVIINDGSNDKTLEELKKIRDKRLKVFSYENGGVALARNRGITHATGKYIAFLDADDLWTSDKLELQLKALQKHPHAGVAYSWTFFMSEKGDILISGKPVYYEGNVYPHLLTENFLSHGSNPLVRREAIDSINGFDSAFPHCADWDFYLRLAARWSFVVVPKHQIYYRQSSSSMTSKIDGIERQILTMLEKTFETIPPEYEHLKKQSFAWLYQYCTQQYLQHSTNLREVNQAGKNLWKAICLYPPILQKSYVRGLFKWFIKKRLLMQLAKLK